MDYTIVIGTHSMRRALRISRQSGYDDRELIFSHLREHGAEAYVSGRFR